MSLPDPGLFNAGAGATRALAPALLSLLCVSGGAFGWIALGLLFVAVGGFVPPVCVRARLRPSHLVPESRRL